MRSYKEDDLTPWRGVPWTVRCQLFSILYQRIVANVARGALISYVFEMLIFSNVDPMSRDVSASGRGFYGYSDADILCIPFWYTMSIEMTKKIIFKPRESSPRVDGVWTCQIIAIKAFRCKLKRGSQIILGGMGTIPYIWQCYPLKSIWFCIVTFRPGRPPPAQRWGTKENYNSIYLVIMVKKSFANRWLLVCLYNGPSLRPTMVSMANDIEMIKMREEWGSSLDLLFSPTRSRYLDLATGINDWLRKVTRSFEFFSSSTGHRSQGIRPCKRILKT